MRTLEYLTRVENLTPHHLPVTKQKRIQLIADVNMTTCGVVNAPRSATEQADDDVFSPADSQPSDCCVDKSGHSVLTGEVENNGPSGDADASGAQINNNASVGSQPTTATDVKPDGEKDDNAKAQPAVRRKSLWDRLCLFRYIHA